MKSPLPKVLHPVAGRPMINYSIRAAKEAGFDEVRVVIGHGRQLIEPHVVSQGAIPKIQDQQLGTGHAVKSAGVEDLDGIVLIMNGDHPLVTGQDIGTILDEYRGLDSPDIAVVTALLKRPGDMGRIIRLKGDLSAIVEAKDASPQVLDIREVNTGFYILRAETLKKFLPQLSNQNAQGEFYLTDLVSLIKTSGLAVKAIKGAGRFSVGVNSQAQLAHATKNIFLKEARLQMQEGVVILDPLATYIEPGVKIGQGSVIYPGVFLKGKTQIGAFCVVEPNCMIIDSNIGPSSQIRAMSYLEECKVGEKSVVGPVARLRPGADLGAEVKIGNFVEIKNTKFGNRSKASHLAYIGDAEIGEDVNMGCGVITVNLATDGKKHKTKVGDRSFVGSDVQLIAPVEIESDAFVAAGSTITKNVPSGALAVGRAEVKIKTGYADRIKSRKK